MRAILFILLMGSVRVFPCDKDAFHGTPSSIRSETLSIKTDRDVFHRIPSSTADELITAPFEVFRANKALWKTDSPTLLKALRGDVQTLLGLNFIRDQIKGENSYFIVRSHQGSRVSKYIGRFVRKTGPNRVIVEIRQADGSLERFETDFLPESTVLRLSPSLPSGGIQVYIEQGTPDLKLLFQTQAPPLKEIDMPSLSLPEKTRREQDLKEKGFGSAYTRGLDESKEWIALAERLRELRADPYKTHVEYFALKIPVFIEYMEQGVLDSKQRKELKSLKERAYLRIREKKVTYQWWIEWTFLLTLALDPDHFLLGGSAFNPAAENLALLQSLIAQYPFNILMPMTAGEFGILLSNEVYSKGILPVGLVNTPGTVDGIADLPPSKRYLHDIGHGENFLNHVRNTFHGPAQQHFRSDFEKATASLPTNERKKVELAYYILEHEADVSFTYRTLDFIKETLFITLSRQILEEKFNFKGLVSFPRGDDDEKWDRINDIRDSFLAVLKKIREPEK